MATVWISNLNDDAYAVLRRRAAESGRSLQEYLRMRLEQEALTPSIGQLLGDVRAGLTSSVSMTDILSARREARDR